MYVNLKLFSVLLAKVVVGIAHLARNRATASTDKWPAVNMCRTSRQQVPVNTTGWRVYCKPVVYYQ